MDRRTFIKLASAGAASMALPSLLKAGRQGKPNFLFIFIDDMGYGDPGFAGNPFTETPNIDRLASEGMIFNNGYVNAPNCAPSRACLMSGQYTPRHGVYTVGSSERGQSRHRKLIPVKNTEMLDPDIVTIPEALKPAGYVSGHFGKWHLGNDKNYRPGRMGDPGSQGFDEVLTTHKAKKTCSGADCHHTKQITDRAMSFMEKNRHRPFFCYVSHQTIHSPWLEDDKLMEYFEDGTLELYNLRDDIGEKNNLAEKLPEKVRSMHKLMLDWRKSIGADVPTTLNPEYVPTG